MEGDNGTKSFAILDSFPPTFVVVINGIRNFH